MNRSQQLKMLAIALSTVTALAFAAVPFTAASAHTGQSDNFCNQVDPTRYGYVILCTFEPVIGQVIQFPGGQHRTVIAVENYGTGNNWVGFDCGHLAGGTPSPGCGAVLYPYEVVGNN